jgi:hypothetical protein
MRPFRISMSSRSMRTTNWLRVLTPSFKNSRFRWVWTVWIEIRSCWAMAYSVALSNTHRTMSVSRPERCNEAEISAQAAALRSDEPGRLVLVDTGSVLLVQPAWWMMPDAFPIVAFRNRSMPLVYERRLVPSGLPTLSTIAGNGGKGKICDRVESNVTDARFCGRG